MKTILLVLAISSVFTSGALSQAPADSQSAGTKRSKPEQYAGELGKVLTAYQMQIAIKIAAEQKAYVAALRLYDDAFRNNVLDSLTLDRTEGAQMAQLSLRANTLTIDQLVQDVRQYAQHDFDQTRSVYQLGIDSYTSYLSNLNSLAADAQVINVLAKELDDLARPVSLVQRLKDLQAYQKSFNSQLHFSDCSMANSLAAINTQKKASIDALVTKIKTKMQEPGTDVANLQRQKKALEDQSASLQAEIVRLQTQRTDSGGFTPGANSAADKCEVK